MNTLKLDFEKSFNDALNSEARHEICLAAGDIVRSLIVLRVKLDVSSSDTLDFFEDWMRKQNLYELKTAVSFFRPIRDKGKERINFTEFKSTLFPKSANGVQDKSLLATKNFTATDADVLESLFSEAKDSIYLLRIYRNLGAHKSNFRITHTQAILASALTVRFVEIAGSLHESIQRTERIDNRVTSLNRSKTHLAQICYNFPNPNPSSADRRHRKSNSSVDVDDGIKRLESNLKQLFSQQEENFNNLTYFVNAKTEEIIAQMNAAEESKAVPRENASMEGALQRARSPRTLKALPEKEIRTSLNRAEAEEKLLSLRDRIQRTLKAEDASFANWDNILQRPIITDIFLNRIENASEILDKSAELEYKIKRNQNSEVFEAQLARFG